MTEVAADRASASVENVELRDSAIPLNTTVVMSTPTSSHPSEILSRSIIV